MCFCSVSDVQICFIMSLTPALVLGPAVVFLWESPSKRPKSIKNQVRGRRKVKVVAPAVYR